LQTIKILGITHTNLDKFDTHKQKPPNFLASTMSENEATKRLAQQGQWKTPPLPVFASGPVPPAADASTLVPLPTTLPTTADEYARMLQEAYKRGAEAAARAQKQGDEEYDIAAAVPLPTSNPSAMTAYPQYPSQPKSVSMMHANAANNYNFPTSRTTTTTMHTNKPMVHQSVSMPDISLYHRESATDEEEKRKKRLARNRASARARRLKKKNLVSGAFVIACLVSCCRCCCC
jgi:hypothetical protein